MTENFSRNVLMDAELCAKLLKRFALAPDTKFDLVGSGSKAQVFAVRNSGLALKLTDDKSDASVAQFVKTKPSEWLAQIYDVVQVIIKKRDNTCYAILTDNYDKLTHNEALLLNRYAYYLVEHAADDYDKGDLGYVKVTRRNVAIFEKLLEEKEPHHTQKPEWATVVQFLRGLAEYLDQNKIMYEDMHAGNAMKNQKTGELVLVDFGYSSFPQQDDPIDVLAALRALANLQRNK